MADLDRTFAEYERGLRQLHEELSARLAARPEEQEYLDLLHQLMLGLLANYASYRLARHATLDTHTSVMYAATGGAGSRVIDVPLRTLVEHGTLTSWQARYLNSSLGTKRTVLVVGGPGSGRSTLLNSLVHLLPVDQRVVAVEHDESLPALRDRAFAVRLSGSVGTPARATAFSKAGGMAPTWLVVDDLQEEDAPAFLDLVTREASGLASLRSDSAEEALQEWISSAPTLKDALAAALPLVVSLACDQGGRPQVVKFEEASVESGELRLEERGPRADQ